MERLTDSQIGQALTDLPGWSVKDGKLHREFEFADFDAAFAFMTKVASECQRMDHHPEWLNVYNRVAVDLMTHDAGGITENDVNLARIMSSAFGAA